VLWNKLTRFNLKVQTKSMKTLILFIITVGLLVFLLSYSFDTTTEFDRNISAMLLAIPLFGLPFIPFCYFSYKIYRKNLTKGIFWILPSLGVLSGLLPWIFIALTYYFDINSCSNSSNHCGMEFIAVPFFILAGAIIGFITAYIIKRNVLNLRGSTL